jgi:branched-chain amino acid transport system ATP-binding protein
VASEPALSIQGVTKLFGGLVATDNLFLDIEPGEIHAIIGPNGAGKTTLIAQLSGELRSNSGRLLFFGRDITRTSMYQRSAIGLARSFQITSVFPDFTAVENVALAIQAHSGHSFRFWKPATTDPTLRDPAMAMLAEIGLDARADVQVANLSHGEQRQLELAMALATNPQVLLLDEPMAGMGQDESGHMVELLGRLKGKQTIILIEHDMDAVFALADRITVLVYGRAIATGNPAAIRENAEVRTAYLGTDA